MCYQKYLRNLKFHIWNMQKLNVNNLSNLLFHIILIPANFNAQPTIIFFFQQKPLLRCKQQFHFWWHIRKNENSRSESHRNCNSWNRNRVLWCKWDVLRRVSLARLKFWLSRKTTSSRMSKRLVEREFSSEVRIAYGRIESEWHTHLKFP